MMSAVSAAVIILLALTVQAYPMVILMKITAKFVTMIHLMTVNKIVRVNGVVV